MPKITCSHPSVRLPLALALTAALGLSGCTTSKQATESTISAPRTTVPAELKGNIAKGGVTAANRRVGPTVSQPNDPQQAAIPADAAVPAAEDTFPPAPAQPQQASIAGLSTQPTGVRAGSGTIFSSAPPVPVVDPSANGPVPANLPRRNFNATTASVYSAPQAVPAAACGADQPGNPPTC